MQARGCKEPSDPDIVVRICYRITCAPVPATAPAHIPAPTRLPQVRQRHESVAVGWGLAVLEKYVRVCEFCQVGARSSGLNKKEGIQLKM